MRWYMWEMINSPQDLWGSLFPGPKMWTKESIYTSPLMTQLKGRNWNESAFSASTLLTISCSSFKTSTLQFFAFSTKASLKSLKRTRQESFGVLPFSLFSNKDAAFSSRSQITREISATNAARHTDEIKNQSRDNLKRKIIIFYIIYSIFSIVHYKHLLYTNEEWKKS